MAEGRSGRNSAAGRGKLRSAALTAAKAAGSVLFLWLAVRKIDLRGVAATVGNAHPGLLVLALLVLFLQIPLSGLRWSRISAAVGAPLPVGPATAIGLVGYFFNLVLPSGVGGDGMRILLMSRRGAGLRLAAASVLVDRVSTLFGLVVLIELGAPFLWPHLPSPEQRYLLPLIGVGTVAGLIVLMAWRRFGRFVPLLGSMRFVEDLSAGAERTFLRPDGAFVLALAVIGQVLSCVALWVLALALGIPVTLQTCTLVFPVVTLSLVLPITVAGWGLRESMLAYGLALFGISAQAAVTLSLAFGVACIVAFLPGLGVWLFMRRSH